MEKTLQRLQTHTRLKACVSKESLVLDYGQGLLRHIVTPLVMAGSIEGVKQAVDNMREYDLLRQDLDSLIEVTQWPGKSNPLKAVDSKTKAAFTKKYNKEVITFPYSLAMPVSSKRCRAEDEDMMLRTEEEIMEEDVDEQNFERNPMIKMKKAKVDLKKSGKPKM